MRTAGRIEFTSQTRFPRRRYAGICLALPSAAQSSKINCSSLLITRASVLIFQARRVQIPCLPTLSAPGTSELCVAPVLTVRETALEVVSCTIPAHRLPHLALLLRRRRQTGVHFHSTGFPL